MIKARKLTFLVYQVFVTYHKHSSCAQIFASLIFVGVACPRKLVPNENFHVYSSINYVCLVHLYVSIS